MGTSTILPGDLHAAAEEIKRASKDTLEIANRIEGVFGQIEKKWEGAPKQIFFQQYNEWHQLSGGFAMMLDNIARELHAMAERYEHADKRF